MQALCRFIPAVALAFALMPAPAQASRASACKAPPFSVPKETQRAVDAAIDARVTGTGAGGASARVAARTDYETTTLSQDAAARAWTEYTLCLKLAKKLISQDLHDELLRSLLTPAMGTVEVADPVADAPEPPPPPATPSPATADLVGTWQVTSRFTTGSCPNAGEGRTTAYTWLISKTGDGALEVAVQGRTSYPVLTGTYSQGRLRVGGPAGADGVARPTPYITAVDGRAIQILSRADFDLQVAGDALVGTRALASWSSHMANDGQGWLIEPCAMLYDVRAQR